MRLPDLAVNEIKKGKIGAIPTDTLYGILGLALDKNVVSRIYDVRRRNPSKPFIILIGHISDLRLFGIKLNSFQNGVLKHLWPGPISVVLPCPHKKLFYLHRGKKTLAFRLPADKWLRDFLMHTGPLVAPSANPEGLKPANTIHKAERYFGEYIDFYIDIGILKKKPSTLISLEKSGISVLRSGVVSNKNIKRFCN